MKHALIVALLLVSPPALASAEDDYIACLIGQAAVALHNSEPKESALEIAYDLCGEMVGTANFAPDTEMDGLEDMVNIMVERMAAE